MNTNSKKIVVLGMILLVLAGIIVVALKGFDVSLMFGKHESIEIRLDSKIDFNVVDEICSEIFTGKEYVVKELEVFGDSVQINVQSITDDEKTNLINKINERFGTTKTVEDLKISSVSNKRIRDVAKPYIVPMLCTYVIVYIYMVIRFRKVNGLKRVRDLIWKFLLLQAILLSIIAIARISVNDFVINTLVVIAILQLVSYVTHSETLLKEYNQTKEK